MKVALVHELLTMRGGAEHVAKVFADMFPDAPIYTLLYDEKKLGDWFPKERVRTSNVQHSLLHAAYSTLGQANNHHLYLKRFPAAIEAWDFSDFDLVISSSSAFAHGIITNGRPKHLCYVHSPARYLFDRTHDVLNRAGQGFFGRLRRKFLERTFHQLRIWDSEAADRPDHLVAASKEVQRRIELYWRRESAVIYPPVDDFWFQESKQQTANSNRPQSQSPIPNPYHLVVSTLVPYKRIDLAISACEKAGIYLKIVGEGPAMASLKRMAGKNVEFYGYRSKDELKDLYRSAQVTIVPGEEDFNLVALESMACGTPVLAYRAGGPLETIVEGKTGAFFDAPTAESLTHALREFKRENFDAAACRSRAEEFSRQKFEEQMQHAMQKVMESK
ncbi:MAG: glycosyltransferase [Candidatus Peribacteraceae bacterium]|nr:glycosyltransferase [Candidatus Peribacteraceae bacterium]MDD5739142.1 glycosyltransferase [Candidatus Peribacteraceae bacterium]